MLLNTYEKVTKLFEEGNGYLSAAALKDARVTTVQIKELVKKGIIERISHGHYWLIDADKGKPENYEMIEIGMVNPRAVVCADSACYFHGLIDEKPRRLSVATLKTDRSKMQMNFPITRHYYSNLAFDQDMQVVETEYGNFRIYTLERSVCDAIRFREDVGKREMETIVKNYMKRDNKKMERLLAYADAMRVGKIVRNTLEEGSEKK